MKHKYFFVRVAWMNKYQGVKNDTPYGAGSWITENGTGGEVYNFLPIKGKFYGYSRNQDGRSYNLSNVGAKKDDEYVDGMTVVFFARNPIIGGQFVVGWYKDSKVFRSLQFIDKGRHEMNTYTFLTNADNGTLVDTEDRALAMPKGPGQSNVWYPKADNKEHVTFLKKLDAYINNPTPLTKKRVKQPRPYQPDIEKKRAVELMAMDLAWTYFEERDFVMKDVSKENVGWDIEATKDSQKILIEVKGLSGDLISVQLSPNEYKHSTRHNFCIAIVSRALNDEKSIEIFKFNKSQKQWIGEKHILSVKEMISAQLIAI